MAVVKALQYVGKHGLRSSLLHAKPHLLHRWNELQSARLDRRLGISTRGLHDDLMQLGASGEHVENATGYEAIQVRVFRKVLRALPVEPAAYQFVDFGSGKGRALILAAEAGFAKVIGVEFAETLYCKSVENIETFTKSNPGYGPIEVYCQDASAFALPPRDSVVFLYNPFDAVVLSKVLEMVESKWRQHRYDLLIAYRNAEQAAVLDSLSWLRQLTAQADFRLYRAEASS